MPVAVGSPGNRSESCAIPGQLFANRQALLQFDKRMFNGLGLRSIERPAAEPNSVQGFDDTARQWRIAAAFGRVLQFAAGCHRKLQRRLARRTGQPALRQRFLQPAVKLMGRRPGQHGSRRGLDHVPPQRPQHHPQQAVDAHGQQAQRRAGQRLVH